MRLKTLIAPVAVGLLVAGAATAFDTGGRAWSRIAVGENFSLIKVCDEGRAVYVTENYGKYNRGGNAMTVVENARECTFGAR